MLQQFRQLSKGTIFKEHLWRSSAKQPNIVLHMIGISDNY